MADLTGFVKSLHIPAGVIVPRELAHRDLHARATGVGLDARRRGPAARMTRRIGTSSEGVDRGL